MTSTDTQPQGFSSGVKCILVTLTVALLIAVYLGIQVQGDTQVGLTLNTQPGLQDGLVGHWSMDGNNIDLGSSTREIIDSSGNGHHGNWDDHASTTRVGRVGQALRFDGSNDIVRITGSGAVSHPLDFTSGPFSMGGWFRLAGANGTILGKRDGGTSARQYQLYVILHSGSLRLIFAAASESVFAADTVIATDEWYHGFVVVDAAGNPQLYINGVAETTSNQVGSPPFVFTHNDAPVSIGARYNGFPTIGFPFEGDLDDIRIYDRALSDAEVQNIYLLGATSKVNKTLNAQPTLEDGLVGHWSMDGVDVDLSQNTAEVRDISGDDLHGDWVTHSSTTKPGRVGQAIDLDGVDDRIVIGDELDLIGSQLTLAAWVKPRSLATFAGIIDKLQPGGTGNYRLTIDNSLQNEFSFGIRDTGGGFQDFNTVGSVLQVGKWVHIVATFDDDTTGRMYVDGSFNNERTNFTLTRGDTTGNLQLGESNANSVYFDGLIDDVRIYDRILSDDEIDRLYKLGATSKVNKTLTTQPSIENGLVGHWTMDGTLVNAVGETVTDRISGVASDWDNSNDEVKPGRIGQAIRFEGGTDRVTISNANDLNIDTYSNWTMTAWVKPETFAGLGNPTIYSYCTLIASIGLSEATSGTDGRIEHWRNNSTSILSDTAVPLNEWSHVAVVYNDGGTTYFYLNGEADGSGASVSINSSTVGSGIGGTPTGTATGGFQGLIDDVRVYDRALSADEIQQIYQLGK